MHVLCKSCLDFVSVRVFLPWSASCNQRETTGRWENTASILHGDNAAPSAHTALDLTTLADWGAQPNTAHLSRIFSLSCSSVWKFLCVAIFQNPHKFVKTTKGLNLKYMNGYGKSFQRISQRKKNTSLAFSWFLLSNQSSMTHFYLQREEKSLENRIYKKTALRNVSCIFQEYSFYHKELIICHVIQPHSYFPCVKIVTFYTSNPLLYTKDSTSLLILIYSSCGCIWFKYFPCSLR